MVRGLTVQEIRWKWAIPLLALGAGLLVLARPAPASAHCDSTNGPVVEAAQQALESGDVARVLPYVQPGAEQELTASFQHALEVRNLGGEAQQLADRYFWETAVRLHRAGEGAAYTGLKESLDVGPALEAADLALKTGSIDGMYLVLNTAVQDGLAEKLHAVEAARELAAREGTVEANRERVEAELMLEKYVYGLYQAATGATVEGAEGPTAIGHTHAAE